MVTFDRGDYANRTLQSLVGVHSRDPRNRFIFRTFFECFEFERLIIIEDDMLLAPDFFSYFLATGKVMDRDPSLLPEVSRTYNFGQVGSSEGQYFRRFLKPMALAGAGVDWETMDLDYLLPQRFHAHFESLMASATDMEAGEAWAATAGPVRDAVPRASYEGVVQSGFPYRNPERLKAALDGSVLCLRAEAAQPQVAGPPSRLIGFARACSDATLVAVIWDVVVDPDWRCLGVGRALVRQLTGRLVQDGIDLVSLFADDRLVGMYEELGFTSEPGTFLPMQLNREDVIG
ncbi:hypothetical protein QBZ16_005448 [Prototheca wickerhamii]|uniref:Alpha-1,3-mannosyl-glycoprotein 2-beta-N-acetylglucosaminyltransferase n=1 Tax=Prototheca wickerhamii TaxID=3111 RepID=A0AAD9IEJ2_PROWI|nr:hypothetical protein QBZ16_005448 [Prototheca wickerhamii]